MASISTDSGGRRRILFTTPDGQRRTLRLGAVSLRTARDFRLRVEALAEARTLRLPVEPALAAWVRDLPEASHARLVRVGLVEPRETAATLGTLLERVEAVQAVSAATVASRAQTHKSLLAMFGAERRLDSIKAIDAERWRQRLTEGGLARATQSKRVLVAKSIFRKAVRWGLMPSSPFADLRAGSQANPERAYYLTIENMRAIMAACPDDEWRVIIGLSRLAGLRCPSELAGLRWGDVNWERGRLTVRSPKTAGHDGHAVRVVPIAPELRAILQRLFDAAEPGTVAVVPRLHDPSLNLRTTFGKIVAKAGVTPWPRLFHNMRASCACDWVERVPNHAVAAMLGHSPLIGARHYLQTRDSHFDLITGGADATYDGGAESDARGAQNAAQRVAAPNGVERADDAESPENMGELVGSAAECGSVQHVRMAPLGLEPRTKRL